MFFDTPSIPAILGTIITFFILDILVVILRFHTRRKLRQRIEADDLLVVVGLVGVAGLTSMLFYGVDVKALGYRWYPLSDTGEEASLKTIIRTIKLEVSSLTLHAATNGIIKISILCFYRRLFVIDTSWKNGRNIFLGLMIGVIGFWAIAFTLAFIFMCRTHFEVLWADSDTGYDEQCVNTMALGYGYAISDFISDALIILVPLPFILKLHLPLGRKIAVIGVFMLGILACGASLVRLAWMVWNRTIGFDDPRMDNGLLVSTELYWMNLEITLGLLAANLPTLRGLLRSEAVDRVMNSVRSLWSLNTISLSPSAKDSNSSNSKV